MRDMPWSEGPSSSLIWIYVRSDETVLMQTREAGHAVQLIVRGPGARRSAYDFATAAALMEHQAVHEAHLLAQGYTLHYFNRDRRSGVDRRGASRGTPDRRHP